MEMYGYLKHQAISIHSADWIILDLSFTQKYYSHREQYKILITFKRNTQLFKG